MAKVGTAEYDVEISRAKVQQEVDAAGKQIEKGLGESAKRAEGLVSDSLDKVASHYKELAVGFAAFKGAQFLGDSVKAASDLAESQSKVGVVFGESADRVREFASSSSEAFGQSQAQALEATGTFGNLFRSIGLTEEQSASFSTTLTGLASDLASFNNTSVDDALTALRAGLVGETEPLKRFGVNLNEATLQHEAFKLGLSDGKGVLDANAKAQAAYSLIMEQTTLAQGDFARTSDGLANQQRILAAKFEDTKASLGEALLPAMQGAVTAADGLLTVFGALEPEMQAATLAAAAGAAVWWKWGDNLSGVGSKVLDAGRAISTAIDTTAIEGGFTRPKAAVEAFKSSLDGLGSTLTTSVRDLNKLGVAAGGLAAGVAAYNLTYKALEQLTSVDVDVEKLADAVDHLGYSGEGLGDVFDVLTGDSSAAELAAQVEELSYALAHGGHSADQAGEAVSGLNDVLGSVMDPQGALEGWSDFFSGVLDGEVRKAEDTLAALDEQLTALAKKDPSQATDAYLQIVLALEAQGLSMEQIAAVFPQYLDYTASAAGKSGEAADAAQDHADAIEAEAKAAEEAQKWIRDLYDARVAAADADEAVNDSVRAVYDAQQGVVQALEDEADAAKGVEEAQRGVADARREVADAQAAVVEAQKGVADAIRDEQEAAKGVQDALAEVAVAEQELADARRRATGDSDEMRSALADVASAQEELTARQQDAIDAQRELDKVTADYGQTLQNLQDQAAGAVDDVTLAEIALRKAQAELANLGKPGKDGKVEPVSADDRTAAEIRVREAERRLRELQQRAEEARQELDRNDDGAANSEAYAEAAANVEQAKKDEAAAHEALQGAVENVSKVQEQAAKDVAAAEQNLAEKVQAVQDARQRQIDAHEAVVAAQGAVQRAVEKVWAAEAGVAAAQENVLVAQGKLNDARQATVEARDAVATAERGVASALEAQATAHFKADGNAKNYAASLQRVLDVMDPNDPHYKALMAYIYGLLQLQNTPPTGANGQPVRPGQFNADPGSRTRSAESDLVDKAIDSKASKYLADTGAVSRSADLARSALDAATVPDDTPVMVLHPIAPTIQPHYPTGAPTVPATVPTSSVTTGALIGEIHFPHVTKPQEAAEMTDRLLGWADGRPKH